MKHRLPNIYLLFLMASICFIVFIPEISCAEEFENSKEELVRPHLFEGFLYFINKNGRTLKAVEKKFPAGLSSHDLALAIIQALIKGPSVRELDRSVPEGTKINSLFILDDGRAFIDFDQNIQTLRDYSAQSEMLTIYSIVNSLILNIEKINRVKILIQGETAQTLSGHIDLDHFYEANVLIVK